MDSFLEQIGDTSFHFAYEEFVDNLTKSHDEVDLLRAFETLLSTFEINRFAYAHLPLGSKPSAHYISNYPSSWTSIYLQRQYQHIDPVVFHGSCREAPFRWGRDHCLGSHSNIARQFFDEAAEFGICSGLTIPILDRRGDRALLTLASDDNRPTLLRLADRYTRAFQLVATSYHIHARRIFSERSMVDGAKLTRREFECLQWAAKGKSAWDIGEILGITRRTAAFHLDNARSKLGVRTVTQAVALMVSSTTRRPS